MIFRRITEADDPALARIVRENLTARGLAIPGTAYFDPELDHLSRFYLAEPSERDYIVIENERGETEGGVGLAAFSGFEKCAEMQKLYLDDSLKGRGLGRELVRRIEERARALGYGQMYLETHTNLMAAIGLYERAGYRLIPRPESVVHSTMDRFFLKEL